MGSGNRSPCDQSMHNHGMATDKSLNDSSLDVNQIRPTITLNVAWADNYFFLMKSHDTPTGHTTANHKPPNQFYSV